MDRSYDESSRPSYMFTFSSKDCPTLIPTMFPTMFLLLHTGATANQLLLQSTKWKAAIGRKSRRRKNESEESPRNLREGWNANHREASNNHAIMIKSVHLTNSKVQESCFCKFWIPEDGRRYCRQSPSDYSCP